MKTSRLPLLAVAPLALLLWAAAATELSARAPSGGGAMEDACDPAVAEALARSAEAGVEADLAIIRHPDQGIRNPEFHPRLLLHPGTCSTTAPSTCCSIPRGTLDDILDLARRRLCAAARDAYRRYLGRALDASIYTVPARRLPGLDLDWRRRSVLDDAGAGDAGGADLFRGLVGGGQ